MKTVLIIDDAAPLNHPLKKFLEKSGFAVIGETPNTKNAVKLYQELKPDMVTIDITLATRDGLAVLQQIKEIDAQARVIVVSQSGQERQVREAMTSGAVAFIIKPFPEEVNTETFLNGP